MPNKFRIAIRSMPLVIVFLLFGSAAFAEEAPLSEATAACLECHAEATPGIVADWKRSAHAMTTPDAALKKPELERRFSAEKVRKGFAGVAVGCAECHTTHPDQHKDTVEHDAFRIYPVVSPADCAVCHPAEAVQYDRNKMANAYPNLVRNLGGKLYEAQK